MTPRLMSSYTFSHKKDSPRLVFGKITMGKKLYLKSKVSFSERHSIERRSERALITSERERRSNSHWRTLPKFLSALKLCLYLFGVLFAYQ